MAKSVAAMNMSASTSAVIMPGSKKRCWTLLFKDIKNNVKEAEVMSSFRKRYTSVRKLAFRPPAPYTTDDDDSLSNTTTGDHHPVKTATGSGGGGSLCIEVQFTGPQPVEGPVGLMCNLLQGTFVAASPVQLGRGRKRKVRSGADPQAFACFAGTSEGAASSSAMDTAEDVTARTDGGRPTSADGGGRYSFDFRSGQSVGGDASVAAAAAAAAAATTKKTSEYEHGGSTTSFGDTAIEAGSAQSFSRSTSSASTSSTVSISSMSSISSNLDDGLDDHLENRCSDGGASYPNKRPYSPSARPNDDGGGSGGDIDREMFTAAFGVTLDIGNSAGAATATTPVTAAAAAAAAVDDDGGEDDQSGEDGNVRASSGLARSCSVMTAAGEDLPKWDEVIRRAATTSSASEAPDASTAASPPPSNPSLAAGRSFYECKGKVMSQEEVVSLFAGDAAPATVPSTAAAAVVAAAATAAAAADAGGVVVSEDGLWDGAPDEADALFSAPPLGRHSSASWGLHPVHAGASTVVADDDHNGDDEDGDDAAAASDDGGRYARKVREQHPPAASSSVQLQQRGRRGEAGRTSAATIAAVDGVKLTPVGSEISLAWREEECDFNGHPCTAPLSTSADTVPPPFPSPPTSPSSPPGLCSKAALGHRGASRPCQFSFSGLRSVAAQGHDPRDLRVFAHFFVDPEARVERRAGPLEVDALTGNDRATAAVDYPSIWDIWPKLYTMTRVKAVEVDMVVDIRSSSGEVVFTGPVLKITYRRPPTRRNVGTADAAPPGMPRTISSCSSPSVGHQEAGFGMPGNTSYTEGAA